MSFWSRLKGEPNQVGEESVYEDPVSAEEAESERYIRTLTASYFVGNDSHLLYSTDDRPAQILPSYLVEMLEHCRGLKSLDAHVESCCEAMGLAVGEPEDEHSLSVKEALIELADAGLLLGERELIEMCKRRVVEKDGPTPQIATVGVVTANRIDELERCLTSFMENCGTFGRTADFAVMDDSASAEVRDATRQMLLELKTNFDSQIFYAGLEEKQRFAQELIAESGVSSEAVNFALFDEANIGFSGGKNRNALLLHTVGDMFYSSDDDAVCRLALPPEDEDDLDGDPDELREMKWWFYADRQSALDSAKFVEEDLLGIHEQLLGRELCECIAASGDTDVLNFEQLDGPSLRALREGTGRVMATFTGVLGDSGAPIPAAYRQLNNSSRERLLRSHTDYFLASKSREVFRSVSRPRVGRITNYNTTAMAFDNREILPPFIPIARGEDHLFGHTMRYCFDGALVGDLPWAILHAPSELRIFLPGAAQEAASGVQLAGLIWACITSRSFWPGIKDGPERMRSIGTYLMKLGSLPLEEFEELLRGRLWQIQSGQITSLEGRLHSHNAPPDYWVDDLQKQVEALREAMTQPHYVVPLDLRLERDIEEARLLSQELVWKFGQLLSAWPEVIRAARRLRAQGRRLAVPI